MAQRRSPPSETSAAPPPQKYVREYRKAEGVHLTAAGIVAKENWRGIVEGAHVYVYYGAQRDKLPRPVVEAIGNQIPFGPITLAELGMKPRSPSHTQVVAHEPGSGGALI